VLISYSSPRVGAVSGWQHGEYDIVGVLELPENTDAAAFAMAVAAGGAARAFKTTPLLSVEEGIEAMRKAREAGYRPPSG
jgi:uncharacterized protein with GYD domain